MRGGAVGDLDAHRAVQGEAAAMLPLAAEAGVILFIVYTAAGNWLFGAAAFDADVWLLAVGCAVATWALEEGRKAWLRRARVGTPRA